MCLWPCSSVADCGGTGAAAATVTVCPSGCAFSQIAPALAAAKNGDTIAIGAGTYDGGLTVDKSVKLVGVGSGRTTISGGGPVLTIGIFGAANEPTVTIDGVTITGGVTRSAPMSTPFSGREGVFAAGGGVEIPPGADFAVGRDGHDGEHRRQRQPGRADGARPGSRLPQALSVQAAPVRSRERWAAGSTTGAHDAHEFDRQ